MDKCLKKVQLGEQYFLPQNLNSSILYVRGNHATTSRSTIYIHCTIFSFFAHTNKTILGYLLDENVSHERQGVQRVHRNTNLKSKIGFKTSSGINISCRNIYWSQFFHQVLIYFAGLITLGRAAAVLAALESRAASTTAARPKVIKPAK